MSKLTDNHFTHSLINQMRTRIGVSKQLDISKQEIQKCWQLEIPYLYKDQKRIRKTNRFVRANADGSEDIVELTNLNQAIYSHDIKLKKIKTSRSKGEGYLFNQITK